MLYRSIIKSYDWKDVVRLHKHAEFGELSEFRDLATPEFVKDYITSLLVSISHGVLRNIQFAKFCLNNIEVQNSSYNNSLFVAHIYAGEPNLNIEYDDGIYQMFIKPLEENILKKLLNKKCDELLVFLTVLNKNETVFSMIENPEYNFFTRNLIKNFNYPNYKHDSRCVFKLKDVSIYPKKYPLWVLDPVILESFSETSTAVPEYYDGIDGLEGVLLHYALRKKYNFFKESNYTAESILENSQDAYNAFEKREYIDLCFSKFLSESTEDVITDIEEKKPFLVFAGRAVNYHYCNEVSMNYMIFIIYTNVLTHVEIPNSIIDNLEFLEYTLLETAKNECFYFMIEQLKKVYERTGKYVKVLDFDNKKYIYEELEETPIFSVI